LCQATLLAINKNVKYVSISKYVWACQKWAVGHPPDHAYIAGLELHNQLGMLCAVTLTRLTLPHALHVERWMLKLPSLGVSLNGEQGCVSTALHH